jgi:hypothetical protein
LSARPSYDRHREGVAVFAINEEGVARNALVHEADLLVERNGGRVVRPNLEFDPDQPSPESVVDCGLEEPEADAAPAALSDDAHIGSIKSKRRSRRNNADMPKDEPTQS